VTRPVERPPRRASIREYITDGSLALLCDRLREITGGPVVLRDEAGEQVEAPETSFAPPAPDEAGRVMIPLLVEGARIGSLEMGAGTADDRVMDASRAMLSLLGRAASELCADVSELRGRVKELDVLQRLSALLVSGADTDRVLEEAFESALEVLDLDAGSLVLLPEDADGAVTSEDESELTLKASRGLSRAWLESPEPLSRGRVFDRRALAGEAVVSEDLLADPRVQAPGRCAAEELRSFIGAGLVFRGRPIGVMRMYSRSVRTFTDAERRLLLTIGEQGAAAVEQARLLHSKARARRVKRALLLAGQVQARMLPSSLPEAPGLDMAARCQPSSELGGDFYDVFEVGDRVAVVVGDVVGKGVPAALLMSAVRATLRAACVPGADPHAVIGSLNDAMCRDTMPNEFATVWLGLIDPGTGEVEYCSAGHDPPFVVRRREEGAGAPTIEPVPHGGIVIGVRENEVYETSRLRLEVGDALVAYTDGVTDARRFDASRYGRDRLEADLLELLTREPAATASQVLKHALWHVRAFSGLAERVDDETMVVVRRTGASSRAAFDSGDGELGRGGSDRRLSHEIGKL